MLNFNSDMESSWS